MEMDMVTMLGEHRGSSRVSEFLRSFACDPIIKKNDGYHYYSLYAAGVLLLFKEDDKLDTVFLYGKKKHGYSPYRGLLPHGLAFSLKRPEVRNLLGNPNEARDYGYIEVFDMVTEPWDVYKYSGHYLNISYNCHDNITQVTIGLPLDEIEFVH